MQHTVIGARGTAGWARHSFRSSRANSRLKRIVADLELDKLILRESLDYLKPKV
jgi:hypothetical protein